MKHYTLYNIHKATRTLLLTASLLLASGVAWGQSISENVDPASEITEILYIKPSTRGDTNSKTINMQINNDSDKLDGYIRWYTEDAEGNKSVTGLVVDNNSELDKYSNGYAWYRTDNDPYPSDACSMTFQFTEEQISNGITLVFEASSEDATVTGWGDNRVLTPKAIGVRHKYIIKNASERSTALNAARDSLEKIGSNDIHTNISTLLNAPNKAACVLHTYTIHTPIQNGTNYRLPERLDNYYVGTTNPQVVQHVRWTMYGADGNYLEQENGNANILAYKFPIADLDTTVSHKRYILTEVSANNNTWYPVSLLNIILEPFSLPLTADELDGFRKNPNYKDRFEDSLMFDGRYELLENISFEDETDEILTEAQLINDPSLNYRKDPLIAESYYAFADPANFANKRNNRLSVGRGEYALYRTLNYENISRRGTNYNGGVYRDYFPVDRYNIAVVDRLYEKTGTDFGYFMYLDAADEPGVITKVPLGNLCASTSLIVSAWICDLTHGGSGDPAHADVGFTFKRIDYTDDGDSTEVILTKYYTGALSNKPGTVKTPGNDHAADRISGHALWQQVSFKFSFSDDEISNDDRSRYILEISNNCPKSNGADYGIDEIKVYRSLPNIDVQRNDACDASTLKVSSDYGTMQRNMGWDLDDNALVKFDSTNVDHRKYRYGLMGDDPYAKIDRSNFGNIYFAFTEVNEDKTAGNWVVINKDLSDKPNFEQLDKTIRVAVQTDMSLNPNVDIMIPEGQSEALESEITMNIRAMNDYNADHNRGVEGSGTVYWADKEKYPYIDLEGLWENGTPDTETTTTSKGSGAKSGAAVLADSVLYAKYEANLVQLYDILNIPRVRCPWIENGNRNILYLSAIDVNNTDLKFAQELISKPGETPKYASGEYYVVVFSASDVANSETHTVNVNAECTLKSLFYVVPSITIKIDTKTQANGVTCIGAIHTLNARLEVADVDENGNVVSPDMFDFKDKYGNEGYDYTFDWFLGPQEDYDELLSADQKTKYGDLQGLIKVFRVNAGDEIRKGGDFDKDDVANANITNFTDEDKKVLTDLLGGEGVKSRLAFGKSPSFRWVAEVMPMPYIYNENANIEEQPGNKYEFCIEARPLALNGESSVPELSVGFGDIEYDAQLTEIPLRLGLPNIKEPVMLEIPIQKNVVKGVNQTEGSIMKKIAGKDEIQLEIDGSNFIQVATLDYLYAKDGNTNNILRLTFKKPADKTWDELFEEGKTYSLYIPFGEYAEEADSPITGSCEGYAVLKIKIVPEYLTWKGNDGVWYDDDNWNQSTEAELYMGNKGAVDANGSDPVENAFSPLYFTKITIAPEGEGENRTNEELILNSPTFKPDGKTLDIETTENIQYDMAVDLNTGVATDPTVKVVPYYINKVSEIYFKPNATLMNQHLLKYDTARVEFTMKADSSYWMASPLKAVYAGDMYAPIGNGKQETPAFDYITFDYSENGTNHRWKLPFYQKAWDKAVAYVNSGDAHSTENAIDVEAVQSNWSIEYNDVWVPYSIGKGFYMRVEENDATVRLPKADKEYTYQSYPTTRAGLSPQPTDRKTAGELAGKSGTADTTIVLNHVDNDGDHFLVGNPYMTYLNMGEFFKENAKDQDPVLNKKYWTIEGGTTKAVVGTPDVKWTGNETVDGTGDKTITGFIPPMTAFFVERAGYTEPEQTTKADGETAAPTEIKVRFTSAMMASQTDATTSALVSRSVSATAPVLTLTAERDGKKGRSVITLCDKADNAYQPQEDAVVLLDSELDAPVAYSVAGNRAAQVNALRSIDNIPVGVYNSRKGDVTVTIEGISQLAEPLYLYDSYTRSSTLLEGESYTMELSGESHGRYYLRSSAAGSINANAITIYSVKNGKVIVSSTEEVRNIKVYSLNGTLIKEMNINTTQHTFNLPKGIYIVRAEGKADAVKTEKVMVR